MRAIKKDARYFLAMPVIFFMLSICIVALLSQLNVSSFTFVQQQQLLSCAALLVYALLISGSLIITQRVNAYSMILIVSFPFFWGGQLLDALLLKPERHYVSNALLSAQEIWAGSCFVLVVLLFLHAGYLLISSRANSKSTIEKSPEDREYSRLCLRRACLIVFAICLIPTIITLGRNIILTQAIGYGARMTDSSLQLSGAENVFGILAGITPFALLGLFVTRNHGEKKSIIAIMTYILVYMLQGSRITAFVLLMVVITLYFLLFSKSNLRTQLIQVGAVFVTIAIVFSFVSLGRGVLSSGGDVLATFSKSNPFVESIAEAGQTFTVTATVLSHTPQYVPFSNGRAFVAGIAYVLPNALTGSVITQVPSVDETYSHFLVSYGGVGSSFVAEGYFNFGNWSLVLFFFYGIALAYMQRSIERACKEGDFVRLFAAAAAFMVAIFFVRSDCRVFFRNYVWGPLPIILVALGLSGSRVKANHAPKEDTAAGGSPILGERKGFKHFDQHIKKNNRRDEVPQ